MSNGQVQIDITGNTQPFEDALSRIGGIAKKLAAGFAIGKVVQGVGSLVTEFGHLEQVRGGVKQLFGEKASAEIIANANKAFHTAQMSAEQYMTNATMYSAKLLKDLKGDTLKAAKYIDKAMIQMSDNANTFGTDMTSIEHAYKNFMRGNFTMLDNLALGYAGSKTGMKELLKDARKLTGKKYKINSFTDIIDAIQAIQDNLKITGKTADEAETTVEGSINMMKAAWANLRAGLGDPEADIEQLTQNLTFSLSKVVQNVSPIVKNIFKALPTVIKKSMPELKKMITDITRSIVEMLPDLLVLFGEFLAEFIVAIIEYTPELLTAIIDACNAIFKKLNEFLAPYIIAGREWASALWTGFVEGLVSLWDGISSWVVGLYEKIVAGASNLWNAGVELIKNLWDGIVSWFETLYTNCADIVTNITDGISAKVTDLWTAGVGIIGSIWTGVVSWFETLLTNAGDIITTISDGIVAVAETISSIGVGIIGSIWAGIVSWFETLKTNAVQIVTTISGGVADAWETITNIGKNIVSGIWDGISSSYDWIKEKITGWVGDVVGWFKEKFDIDSPSKVMRDEVGKFIGQGVAVGILDEEDAVKNAFRKITDFDGMNSFAYNASALAEMNGAATRLAGGNYNNIGGDTINIYAQKMSPAEVLAEAQYSRQRRSIAFVSA